ncbi:hypothetical protein WH96_20280 [Kiloniella spongiae]|uniref:Uncharacterized protein n=1 Tax=Kiloniella spongiae TaxID=1489064 RepID=A0A0H2MQJ0_9PROT|nr:hypothetical protein [Kiloniella spongiae]KLN58930.1 hypothetical protein WH96_20280 [Kiloniella spongiae]
MINLLNSSWFDRNTAANSSNNPYVQQAREQALLANKAKTNSAEVQSDTTKNQDQISISPEAQKLIYQQQLDNPRSDRQKAADIVRFMPSSVKSMTGGLNWMDAAKSATVDSSSDIANKVEEAKVKDMLEYPMEYLRQITPGTLSAKAQEMGFEMPQSLANLTQKQAQSLVLKLM